MYFDFVMYLLQALSQNSQSQGDVPESLDVSSLLNQGAITIDPVTVSDAGLASIIATSISDSGAMTFQ